MGYNKNKNIAFYIGDYTRSGGTERACTSVVNGLAIKGNYNLYLIVTNKPEEKSFFEIDPKVKVLYLNIENYKKQYLKFLFRLEKTLRKYKIDVIVAVEVMSLLFIQPTLYIETIRGGETKLIVWEHFNFLNNNGRLLRDYFRKLAAKKADAIITLTERDRKTWSDNLKIKGEIDYIYNIGPTLNNSVEYNENSKTIIAVGRFVQVKGFKRLLLIWAQLSNKYDIDGWKLKIIGGGDLENELQKCIAKHNIESSVDLIKNTNNIQQYYEEASFLCMTSYFEGLPMVLIEAQTYALPTIAYDCYTGPSEIIDEYSGFLIEEDNEEAFVDSIYKLISDNELRQSMSKKSKQLSKRFEEQTIVSEWEKLFKELYNKS